VGQLCRAGWRCCWAWAGAQVADEASETIGKQLARQASRELKPMVIGENMERVKAYAGEWAETIDDWLAGRQWSLKLNVDASKVLYDKMS